MPAYSIPKTVKFLGCQNVPLLFPLQILEEERSIEDIFWIGEIKHSIQITTNWYQYVKTHNIFGKLCNYSAWHFFHSDPVWNIEIKCKTCPV